MEPRVVKILWFAILCSVIFLYIISDFLSPIEIEDRSIINWIFTICSIGVGVLALMLGNKISLTKTDNLYPKTYLLQLLLIDSISIFGFILKILGASATEAGIYFFISFMGLILVKPSVGGKSMPGQSSD